MSLSGVGKGSERSEDVTSLNLKEKLELSEVMLISLPRIILEQREILTGLSFKERLERNKNISYLTKD